mmetsp:Transcript_3421/g.5235  ORF Transcript_3421/g.5235 Transcript_3421/m.5235 type:complete len:98 (-) Transcript_3421:177-470(-)
MSPNSSTKTKQSQEARKEEFRKYLESTGVIDTFTRLLVNLYEEPKRPSDALGYIMRSIRPSAKRDLDIDALQKENASLKAEVSRLSKQLEESNNRKN